MVYKGRYVKDLRGVSVQDEMDRNKAKCYYYHLREQGVGSSNLLAPTKEFRHLQGYLWVPFSFMINVYCHSMDCHSA